MRSTHIQDILPLVEAPSRYLGSEVNAVQKDHRKVKLKMALAFPDLYEIGSSHFGLQILYHILNQHPDILAERVFTPGTDMEGFLRKRDLPLQSLESGRPLGYFDILGFSLLYELNYTNVLTMLDLAQIPFKSKERDARHPLVIAGGPCTCNPEPVADFFDAIVVGDGEEVLLQMAEAWIDWHQHGDRSREALLKHWSELTGGLCSPLCMVGLVSRAATPVYRRRKLRQHAFSGPFWRIWTAPNFRRRRSSLSADRCMTDCGLSWPGGAPVVAAFARRE